MHTHIRTRTSVIWQGLQIGMWAVLASSASTKATAGRRTHTYAHTHHKYTYTHTEPPLPKCTHTRTHTHTHTCELARSATRVRAVLASGVSTKATPGWRTHTHAHTHHKYTCTHTELPSPNAHTHTHTHTHVSWQGPPLERGRCWLQVRALACPYEAILSLLRHSCLECCYNCSLGLRGAWRPHHTHPGCPILLEGP